jgi:uncharacterized membrane-anchored protein YitT (DUF2179 family)
MKQFKFVDFAAVALGAGLAGLGINAFNIANQLAEGGVTGISILLKLAFGWDPGLVTLVVNVPLLVLGWWIFGGRALVMTIFGTLCLSAALTGFGRVRYPVEDHFVAALLAGCAVGAGLGIVFRFGGTTGGVDIIARILRRYRGWRMGRTIFAADLLVVGASLLYLDTRQAVYTLVAVFVGARVIDLVQEAGYSMRAALIISDEYEQISARVMEELERGVTLLEGSGAYTGKPRPVLYVVVNRAEAVRLKNLVLSSDRRAFFSIFDAGEVTGEGFARAK